MIGYCQVFVSQKDSTLFKKATTNDIMIYIILTTADLGLSKFSLI